MGRLRFSTDLLLSLVLAVAAEIEVFAVGVSPKTVSVPATLIAVGALAWRRRAPLAAALFAIVPFGVESWLGVDLHRPVAPVAVTLLAAYSLGANAPFRLSLAGIGALLTAMGASVLGQRASGASDFAFASLLTIAPWLVGIAMRNRASESQQFALRAERLERERAAHAEAAAAAERSRIARELHDVIAHSLSVMIVQAGAAEEIAKHDPARVAEPLRSIQRTGRQALAEMSRLLGILREGDWHTSELAPHPGISQLRTLVADNHRGGLPVELRIEGEPRELSEGVDLSVYRIVQESLTNVRKHAGAAAAQVIIRYGEDAIELEVLDDGPGVGDGAGGGNGLIGMRERVAVFGGSVTAGPRREGGFRVLARLPIEGRAE